MKPWMAAGTLATLVFTMSAAADITVNAYAQDGAVAVLYDVDGNLYASNTFSSGQAVISTAGLASGSYGLGISYKPDEEWSTLVGWGVEQYMTLDSSSTYVIQDALTGEITARSISGTTASLTMEANGPIGSYNNGVNLLNAQLGLYRPVYDDAELSLQYVTITWDAATLESGFGYNVAPMDGSSLGLSVLTVTNDSGFHAEYAAQSSGGDTYDLFFRVLDRASALDSGQITSAGNSVTFTVNSLGNGLFDPNVPYYLNMDAAWMYDSDGNYSEIYDAGVTLTRPDVMIPEPAVASLIGLVGVSAFMIRRIFGRD